MALLNFYIDASGLARIKRAIDSQLIFVEADELLLVTIDLISALFNNRHELGCIGPQQAKLFSRADMERDDAMVSMYCSIFPEVPLATSED